MAKPHQGARRRSRLAMLAVACSTRRAARPPRPPCGHRRPGQYTHRLLERLRHRQRLPRGAALHRQGAGARRRARSRRAPGSTRTIDAIRSSQQIRDLIAKLTPTRSSSTRTSPDGLNPALDEAQTAGIKTVAIDAYVTDPDTLQPLNNQVKYGYVGAKLAVRAARRRGQRLLHARHRRPPGRHRPPPGRHEGALEEYPGITLCRATMASDTDWDPDTGHPAHQRTSSPAVATTTSTASGLRHRPAGR